MFHAGGDFAPNGILAIEEAGIIKADEKLAIGTVRV